MESRFCLPNYKDGSIVNLMSSIGGAFGWKSGYKELKGFSSKEIKKYKNVVLIVVDGLGYEYLKEKGRGSFMNENLKGKMTSVFLPTTACAISSFLTGDAPQQHGYTGWHMNLKEIGVVVAILPFVPRVGGEVLSKQGVDVRKIFGSKSFCSRIKGKCFSINPGSVVNSDFSKYVSKGSKRLSYKSLNGFFRQIKKVIGGGGRKYVYAYWNEFDETAHDYGVGSKKTKKHFEKLDREIKKFAESIKVNDTLLIITADHGFIDTPLDRIIWLEKYPKLQECLTLPLCGEGRVAYCYVHPSKIKQFEKYVKGKLSRYCWLYGGEDLIKKNLFGLGKANPKLFDRVGDYVLVCKDNYIIKDKVGEEKKKPHVGHHGGISREEMLVPLVVIES